MGGIMVSRRHLKLYSKVFLVLLAAGFILPNIIDFFFGNILLIEDKAPTGNSIFVLYNNDYQNTFFKTFFNILAKFLEF